MVHLLNLSGNFQIKINVFFIENYRGKLIQVLKGTTIAAIHYQTCGHFVNA